MHACARACMRTKTCSYELQLFAPAPARGPCGCPRHAPDTCPSLHADLTLTRVRGSCRGSCSTAHHVEARVRLRGAATAGPHSSFASGPPPPSYTSPLFSARAFPLQRAGVLPGARGRAALRLRCSDSEAEATTGWPHPAPQLAVLLSNLPASPSHPGRPSQVRRTLSLFSLPPRLSRVTAGGSCAHSRCGSLLARLEAPSVGLGRRVLRRSSGVVVPTDRPRARRSARLPLVHTRALRLGPPLARRHSRDAQANSDVFRDEWVLGRELSGVGTQDDLAVASAGARTAVAPSLPTQPDTSQGFGFAFHLGRRPARAALGARQPSSPAVGRPLGRKLSKADAPERLERLERPTSQP
eukprot:364590-Chlamydomonas_euryale.AAC.12